MKKIVIPTILAATILVAGMFAMMPVQKASTVHSSLGGNYLALTATIIPFTAASDTATWTVGVPFCVVGAYRTGGVDADANLDNALFVISTNLSPAPAIPFAVNDAAGAASIAAADLIGREVGGVADVPLCGSTTVALGNTAAAGTALIDTNNITVLIETRGSVAAPAAVLS